MLLSSLKGTLSQDFSTFDFFVKRLFLVLKDMANNILIFLNYSQRYSNILVLFWCQYNTGEVTGFTVIG
jgi:hypothetical protein